MQNSSKHELLSKDIPLLKYQLINKEADANIILQQILNDKGCVLGVDIEAAVEMSRFGILCLIQIAYKDCAYIFDMLEINPKFTLLKEVFTDEQIIKVFHDCSEDCSILFNLYKYDLQSTFDTQIAHRLCYEDVIGCSMSTKHASISLNDLLKEYLGVEHTVKGEMHTMMNNDPYFWKKRPLSDKMLEYTALDVLFLPKIYDLIKENCQGSTYKSLTFDKIFFECQKYLEYCKINLSIKNFNKISIEKDKIVEGLIKNFQKNCIFIQLNIGYNGIITNKKTIHFLMSKFKVGDILNFRIVKLDDVKKRYMLDYSDKDVNENKKENLNNTTLNSIIHKEDKEQQDLDLTVSSFKKKLNINVSSYYPSKMKGQGSITVVSQSPVEQVESNYPIYLSSSPYNYIQSSYVYSYPYAASAVAQDGFSGMTFDYVSYSATNIPESKSPNIVYKEDRSIYDIDLHNTENY